MNEFQAKLCTFFIKDKEKKAFVKKMLTDKNFYVALNKKIEENNKNKQTDSVNNDQTKTVLFGYEKFKAISKRIGERAAADEYLSEYIEPVRKEVQSELLNVSKEMQPAENVLMFTMWLQDNSPELIQMCIDSVKRFYPNLIIISEKNIFDYVKIPDCIWKKYKDGLIPPTQFSDYIRVALLDKYGGIWIDATYYMLAPIPRYMYKAEAFVLKSHEDNMISSNFLKFEKNNYLVKMMRIFFEQYWEREDFLIGYFFFHIFFMLIVRKDAQCAEIWRNIPYGLNTNPQFLLKIFSQNFDEDVLKYVRQTSFMYKLTYKDKNAENNPNSWYWYLINQWRKGVLLTSALEHTP